MKMCTAVYYKK